MRKKIKIIIIMATALVLLTIAVLAYYNIFYVEIKPNAVEFWDYKEVSLDSKTIKRINQVNSIPYGFTEIYPINSKIKKHIGNVFEACVKFKVKRPNKLKDYYVGTQIDFSGLDETEMIFWGADCTNPKDQIFACYWPDELEMSTYCSLYGVTAGKSKEEINRILKKIKFILTVEDEMGRITEKKMAIQGLDVSVCAPDESDYFGMKECISLSFPEK